MATYAEMGRYPVAIGHKVRIIKYWLRLIRIEGTKTVTQLYSLLQYLTDLDFDTWTSYVK